MRRHREKIKDTRIRMLLKLGLVSMQEITLYEMHDVDSMSAAYEQEKPAEEAELNATPQKQTYIGILRKLYTCICTIGWLSDFYTRRCANLCAYMKS